MGTPAKTPDRTPLDLTERDLTFLGKRIRELEPGKFGVIDDGVDREIRFTREQIVKATCALIILLTQTMTEDPTTVTTDIEKLLQAGGPSGTVQTAGIASLLVPREDPISIDSILQPPKTNPPPVTWGNPQEEARAHEEAERNSLGVINLVDGDTGEELSR